MPRRRPPKPKFRQKVNAWFKSNLHYVAWGTLFVTVLGVFVSIVPNVTGPQGSIDASLLLTQGPLASLEECNENGWILSEDWLYAFNFFNKGDKTSTINYGVVRVEPFKGRDENIGLSAMSHFFTNDEAYLSTLRSLDQGLLTSLPVNLYDTKVISYSLPLVIEPGITKSFVIKLNVYINVKSGDPRDLAIYRSLQEDPASWRLLYHFQTSEGAVFSIPIDISQIPMFGDQIICPPASN